MSGHTSSASSNATNATSFYSAGGSSLGTSESSLHSFDDIVDASQDGTFALEHRYSVWVSFIEIYNEQVYDLLVPFTGKKAKDRPVLKLSEDKRGDVYIKGARDFYVNSVEEAMKLAMVGRKNLQIAATKLNYNSSRSHCIYSIRLLKEYIRPGAESEYRMSRLSFCDLAGSERTSKIEGGGERVKETGYINTSLLTLCRCIRILEWNQTHRNQPQIIPFRDSKLTRLFQHYLAGKATSCMVVNISQCASSFDETLHVLKFSAVAKEVKTVKDPVVLPSTVVSPPPPKFSLLLKEFRGERQRTIAWANSERSSDTAPAAIEPLNKPLPDEEEEGEDAILDKTLDENNEVIQQYLTVIEDLKAKLIEARKRNLLLEAEVREEVCQEYSRLYHEMENFYKQNQDEAVADVEQLAEDRMELYVQTVRKRRRTEGRFEVTDAGGERENQEDDDAWVPAENLQVKEKENESLRVENQRLQKELAEATGKSCAGTSSSQTYAEEISALKRTIEKQERELHDLRETIEEAGQEFEKQQAKIVDLERKNEQLEMALKTKTSAGSGGDSDNSSSFDALKNENRELREKYAAAMEASGRSATKSVVPKTEDGSGSEAATMDVDKSGAGGSLEMDEGFKLIELESKIFELERSLETANQKATEMEKERDAAVGNERDAVQRLEKVETKLNEQSAMERQLTELTTEIDELKSKEAVLKEENVKLDENAQKMSESMETAKAEAERLEKKVLELESQATSEKERSNLLASQKEAVESTLRLNLEKMLEMQRKLKETEDVVVVAKTERDRVSGEYEKRIEKLSVTVTERESEASRVRDLMQELEKNVVENASKASTLEQQATALEETVKKFESEKAEAASRYEELLAKFDENEKELVIKRSELIEVTADVDRLKAAIKELEEKLDQERRGSLEEGNRWRLELEEVKTTLVNTKKEKLELRESMKSTEDECKRLTRSLETKETEVKEEKEKSARLVSDMQKNQDAIQSYKNAIKDVSETTDKYEEILTKKNQELTNCQREIQSFREKYESAEKNFVLEQKKSLRLKNELDLKTEVENKLKADFAALQGKLGVQSQESDGLRKQMADSEMRFQHSSQSITALRGEIEHLKSTNELLKSVNDALKKDAQNREVRLSEMDTRLAGAKKQSTDYQQRLLAKNKEIEDMTRTYEEARKTAEQLEVRFRNAEDERSSLVETVRQLKAENEKLAAARVPPQAPVGPGRRRGTKGVNSSLEHDNAEEVEVTPMASRPQKSTLMRKKTGSATDVKEEPSDSKQTQPARRGRKAKRDVSQESDATSDATSSIASGKSPSTSPVAAGKASQRKARATKESQAKSSISATNVIDFPFDMPVSNTGRPQRRAAQIASNGIVAVNEFYRNSSPSTTATSLALASATDSDSTAGSSMLAGNEPFKKRRRALVDPTVPFCSPVVPEDKQKSKVEAVMETVSATVKKLNPRKK